MAAPLRMGDSALEMSAEELDVREQVGGGGFSLVYKALYHGAPVAVKKWFDPRNTEDMLRDFREEVEICKDMRHPNVVQVLGACTLPPNLFIAFEYVPTTLHGVLHETSMEIDKKRVVGFMLDALRAFRYLHSRKPPITHRDVKPANFLVTRSWTVKLCDFGLASGSKAPTAGTPAYMAPELHAGETNYTTAVDIYALGVMLCEMICRAVPFDGLSPPDIRSAVLAGERPRVALSCPRAFKACFEQAWDEEPSKRPDAAAFFEAVKGLPTQSAAV